MLQGSKVGVDSLLQVNGGMFSTTRFTFFFGLDAAKLFWYSSRFGIFEYFIEWLLRGEIRYNDKIDMSEAALLRWNITKILAMVAMIKQQKR